MATLVGAPVVAALTTAVLPAVAYRLSVPWGTPSRAECGSCQRPFRRGWSGWIRLGSSCPWCGAAIGPSVWWLSAAAAAAALGLAWRFGPTPTLAPFLALVPMGCLLCAIDLACHRLPERLVLPSIGAAVAGFGAIALGTGDWWPLTRAVLGGLALGGGYLLLLVISLGQLGGGDVTLGALLGVFLGWLGWPYLVLGAVLPFAVNAPVAIGLLVTRRATRHSELPFGPAMLVGAYVAVVGPALLVAVLAQ